MSKTNARTAPVHSRGAAADYSPTRQRGASLYLKKSPVGATEISGRSAAPPELFNLRLL